ncbi:hypothetical protein ACIBHX_27880 [Nonomuraea sp. NPDC050536]|uniref:hypothetical protein n=1 Tax=Nonomuraea sp. NPDC050536 TaxID=3364366 RepID=UPI0037C8F7CC
MGLDGRVLLLAVEAADALLRAHHEEPDMVEEIRVLLRFYLSARLGPVREG